jgi:hypothetical protein
LRLSPSGVDLAIDKIKDADDNNDFNAILAARAKRRRVETTVTEPTCTLGGRESKCEVAIIEDETVLPKVQCTLDEQDSKDKAKVKDAIVEDAIARDKVMIAEDVAIVEDDVVITKDTVIAEDVVMDIEDEAKDVSHVDDDVAPVDSPVIAAEETPQRAVDDEDRESVLTDLDSPTNTDAREDEPVYCVLSDAGGTEAKRGRKAGARGKISPQAELATTKDVSHTDPLLSEAVGTRVKRGRKVDGVLPKAGETKAKRGRKVGASGRKKR